MAPRPNMYSSPSLSSLWIFRSCYLLSFDICYIWYLLYFVICYLISLASHVSILEYDEVWILNVEYYIFLIYFYLTAHNSEKKILLVVQKKPLTNKKISFAGLNSWKKSFKRRCNIQYSKFKLRHIPKLTMIWQRY